MKKDEKIIDLSPMLAKRLEEATASLTAVQQLMDDEKRYAVIATLWHDKVPECNGVNISGKQICGETFYTLVAPNGDRKNVALSDIPPRLREIIGVVPVEPEPNAPIEGIPGLSERELELLQRCTPADVAVDNANAFFTSHMPEIASHPGSAVTSVGIEGTDFIFTMRADRSYVSSIIRARIDEKVSQNNADNSDTYCDD